MKHIIYCVVMLFHFLIFSITIAASPVTYQLDDVGLSLEIPSDYVVFTRDTDVNNPNLNMYGFTKDEMLLALKEKNTYLDAWDTEITHEITVTMTGNVFSDFNILDYATLNELSNSLKDEYESAGITFINSDIYQHRQAKFIVIYMSIPDGDSVVYGMQYYTIFGGKAINITLHSYNGIIDDTPKVTLHNIIDSINFIKNSQQRNEYQHTDAFLYTDDETGTAFTVPADWSQEELSEKRELLDAKFTNNLEDGLIILYSSYDVWNELSSEDKIGLNRSDINNSAFTIADMAEMLEVKQTDITKKYYGNIEYYMASVTKSQTVSGITFEIPMTYLYRFENGYGYNFQFSASKTSPYFSDFETLVSSVQYPAVPQKPSGNNSSNRVGNNDEISKSWFTVFLTNLFITVLVHPLPLWIYRYHIKKQPVAPQKALRIVIVDAILVFAFFSVVIIASGESAGTLSLPAILVWSRICYSFLKKGYVEVENHESEPVDDTYNDCEIAKRDETIETNVSRQHNTNTFQEEINSSDESEIESAPLTNNEMVFCHKCRTKLNQNSRFCSYCGTQIPANPIDHQIPSTVRTIRFCRRCGFKLLKGSTYCSRCGNEIEKEEHL